MDDGLEELGGGEDPPLPDGAFGTHNGRLAATVDTVEQLHALNAIKANGDLEDLVISLQNGSNSNLLSLALSLKDMNISAEQEEGAKAAATDFLIRRLVMGVREKGLDIDTEEFYLACQQ